MQVPMKPFVFSARMKLKSSSDFRHVMNWRVKLVDNGNIAYMRHNGLELNRLGVSVGKRHGNAVRRNYLKRLVREAFRLSQSGWGVGLDLVCIPSVDASQDSEGIERFFLKVGDWIRQKNAPSGGRNGPPR